MTDWQEHEPIYIQLAQLVLDQIMRGTLAEGEAAPSVRQVASQERINPLTVSRAYQTLVDDGMLEKRRGLGMFVSDGAKARAIETAGPRALRNRYCPEPGRGRIAIVALHTVLYIAVGLPNTVFVFGEVLITGNEWMIGEQASYRLQSDFEAGLEMSRLTVEQLR